MATQIDLGAVVPIGKGDWNASTTYERTNIVRHNSTAWICKVATSTGVEPTESSSDWYLLVKDTSSVTSVNGMIGDVNINSILENPSANDNSLKIASTSWVKTKVDNATNELNTQISQVSSKASTALQTANSASNKADNALSKAEEASNKSGLPLGYIYLWPFSTPPDGSIQVNGSTYNRELYSDLWSLIQEKGWYKSESEWQSIASANGGYCPWYSNGDGSTTFRTPKFAPYQKLALTSRDAGKYYEAELPDIQGSCILHGADQANIILGTSGAMELTTIHNSFRTPIELAERSNTSSSGGFVFRASNYNSIYGNSDTVQPESHDWIVCVVAFGKATNIGSVDVANVMSAVSQVQATAIEIDSSGYSSSQHWVRYKDGRQIIYSDWMENMNNANITFIKPFTTNPAMIGFDNANVPANMERKMKFTAITGTYFTTEDWAYGSPNKSGCWLAMGTWK